MGFSPSLPKRRRLIRNGEIGGSKALFSLGILGGETDDFSSKLGTTLGVRNPNSCPGFRPGSPSPIAYDKALQAVADQLLDQGGTIQIHHCRMDA